MLGSKEVETIVKNKYSVVWLLLLVFCSLNSTALSREERILERIKPIGSVYLTEGSQLAESAKPTLGKDAGLKRYKATCYLCHDTGASGAPKLGDKGAWSARIKTGKNTLYDKAIKGFNAMPAKGGCLNCSDQEIEMTVDYMIQKSQ